MAGVDQKSLSYTWRRPECNHLLYERSLLSQQNAICSNMDGPWDYHTKWSKSDRERQISYDITYMWNLKNDTNELIYKIETDSQK